MGGTMSAKEALKNLWKPKAAADQKGKAVKDRPGVARVTEVIRALIPLIILGLVLLVLHFAAPSAFNWVISYGSLGAKLTGSLIPAAIALLTIGIGVGNRVKHNYYLDSLNKKQSEHSNHNSELFDENKSEFNMDNPESKIDNNKNEISSLIISINKAAKTMTVTKSLISETKEGTSERALEVNLQFGDASKVVDVKIPLSNDTQIIQVKYLIAKYLGLIQDVDEVPTMPVMNIFIMSDIQQDEDKIGDVAKIGVRIELKEDDK